MKEIFKNAGDLITLEDCVRVYKGLGVATIVNDGKDVTIAIENAPSQQA